MLPGAAASLRRYLILVLLSSAAAAAATVSCTNSANDAGAIQAAINQGGAVTINNVCALGGTVIQINNSAAITGKAILNSAAPVVFSVNADNVSISGLTLNGAGLTLTKTPSQSGFSFTGNTIENTNGKDGIQYGGILRNSKIDSNTFYYIAPNGFLSASFGALGFPGCYASDTCENKSHGVGVNINGGLDQTAITNNTFDVIANDAVHVGWNYIGDPSLYFLTANANISYNSMSRVHRIGLEIQAIWTWPSCGVGGRAACDLTHDFSTGTLIKGNYFHDPFLAYTNTYGYSLALWGDAQYLNNAAIMTSANACTATGYGIEDMGNNVLTQGNVLAADYMAGCNPHGWGMDIVYGGSRPGTTFTTQNNILCGDQSATRNFGIENGNSQGTKVNQYNLMANTCYNSGSLTTSSLSGAFTSADNQFFASGGAAKWSLSVLSALPVKYVQFFIDNSASPVATQEAQDVNTNFANDHKWYYHAAFNTSTLSAGSHILTARATDLAGASRSVSQSFSVGLAGSPGVQLTPQTLSFPSQTAGLSSAAQTVSLKNTGAAALSIGAISVSGANAADFSASNNCGASLPAAASCVLSVTFTPSGAGRESAGISIGDNAAGSPHSVALSGVGVAPSAPAPPPPPPPPSTPPPAAGTLPTNLPTGMSLWLANDAGLIVNGNAVSMWEDQSGNGNHAVQSNPVNQPLLAVGNNGHNAVHFNGASSFLSIGSLPIDGLTGMTVFVVSANATDMSSNAGYGSYALLNWTEGANWGGTFFGSYQNSSRFRFGTTQSGNENAYQMPFTRTNSFGLSEWLHAAGSDSMWFNSQAVASYSGKMQVLAGAGTTVYLGQGNNHTFYPGDVSEIIVYNRSLSNSERQTVEHYLMSKYHL